MLDRPLVQAVLAAGAGRDVLSYRTLKVLADLDPAVDEVVGFTRYRIEGDPRRSPSRSSTAAASRCDVPSRVERNPQLVGTKRRVATSATVLVARGRSDGRTVIFVPEVKAGVSTGSRCCTCGSTTACPADDARRAPGLRPPLRPARRLGDGDRGLVPTTILGDLPVADLLIRPISETADHWRSAP